jgi:hypothetical protein
MELFEPKPVKRHAFLCNFGPNKGYEFIMEPFAGMKISRLTFYLRTDRAPRRGGHYALITRGALWDEHRREIPSTLGCAFSSNPARTMTGNEILCVYTDSLFTSGAYELVVEVFN